MITHSPFRLTTIALACHMGLPTSPATVRFRPILNVLPIRRLQEVLKGPKLYAVVAYAFKVEQLPPLDWRSQ